jgi:shikimate 5-dehydrogenase
MNEANQIGRQTKLFGFIAEEAQQNRFSVTINRLFKTAGDDAMVIPMNIREDDFYFTLSNMRDAQLSGAFIAAEYQKDAAQIVDIQSELSQQCGACDVVVVKEKKLIGDFIAVQSLFELLDERGAKKIAVIGGGALAKAIAVANEHYSVAFYHEYIESLMKMGEAVMKEIDINRLMQESDLSVYDAVIDASTAESLAMVKQLPGLCIDLKNDKAYSPLRQRAGELGCEYIGYELLLARLTKNAYNYINNL